MSGTYEANEADNSQDDRISNLPGNIIDCILECLPLRDAARTCILSRGWRYVWATMPQLMLDRQFIESTIKGNQSVQYAFPIIVNSILLLHKGPILKFELHIPAGYDISSSDIDLWMLVLSRSGIKELTIDNLCDRMPSHPLPFHLFSCSALTQLTLSGCKIKLPDTFPCFPKLVRLICQKVEFMANLLGSLFYCAPKLEALLLRSCSGIENYNILSTKLRSIAISGFKRISFEGNTNLGAVSIISCQEVDRGTKINLIEFTDRIPLVRILVLDGYFLKALASRSVPKRISTVRYLERVGFYCIDLNDSDQVSCALCLLSSSPNLKNLQMKVVNTVANEPATDLLRIVESMELKLSNLQIVDFACHKCSKIELLFIKFLLGRSPSLRRLIVDFSGIVSADEELRISIELMSFSRVSPSVEIVIKETLVENARISK